MNAKQVLSNCLTLVTPKMHKTRRKCLFAAVDSVVNGATLSVTGLGRNITGAAREKHRIKRVDRLCSNTSVQRECELVYCHMALLLIDRTTQPVIHVDWSDLDSRKQHFLIRASLAASGRSLTLYEEVHPLSLKEKPKTHRQFMTRLKAMLPADVVPIIVTDAGFRIPWFNLVSELGWHYVGRVRNRIHCRRRKNATWRAVKSLYSLATQRPKELGRFEMGEKVCFTTRLTMWHRKAKGRTDTIATGERRRRSKRSRACAEREKEPWLIATSLPKSQYSAKRLMRIYATRMQIEESFRDVKTGLGMNGSNTRNSKRLRVLLLIAAIAQYFLYLLGLAVKAAGYHRHYQANSIRHRSVLSNQFIGLRAYKDPRLRLNKQHWRDALAKLRTLIVEPKACY